MTYHINLQIVPFAGDLPEGFGNVVLLPAREGQGEEQPCANCDGTGRFGRHDEQCRKCEGTGRGRFVRAFRGTITTDEQRAIAEQLLDGLPEDDSVRVQRTIELHETGGGMTNTGRAQIVCGLKGEPLRSMWGRTKCGGSHAVFFPHAAMIVSYSHHRGTGSGEVRFVGVDREARHNLAVIDLPLWAFRDGDDAITELEGARRMPQLAFPSAAVQAARAKAKTYHCRSASYVESGGAHGPSGALRGAGAAFGGMPSPLKGPGIGY